jgi:uncharacterized protein YrrD
MLRSVKSTFGSTIHATDRELGRLHDVLFDDRVWRIRYLVVETGGWLSSRKVLLSPSVSGRTVSGKPKLPVNLTMDQVRHSPEVDVAHPVSRQHEIAMSQHYAWPAYWTMERFLMPVRVPGETARPEGDTHLRSAREVASYSVRSSDENIGRIDDFIRHDGNWSIRYLVVRTGSWFSGQQLLLPAREIDSVSFRERAVLLVRSLDEL